MDVVDLVYGCCQNVERCVIFNFSFMANNNQQTIYGNKRLLCNGNGNRGVGAIPNGPTYWRPMLMVLVKHGCHCMCCWLSLVHSEHHLCQFGKFVVNFWTAQFFFTLACLGHFIAITLFVKIHDSFGLHGRLNTNNNTWNIIMHACIEFDSSIIKCICPKASNCWLQAIYLLFIEM